MTQGFSRRGFLAASAALAALPAIPRLLRAETPPRTLRASSRILDIGGRAASVLGLENDQGGQGLILDPGARFRVELTNALDQKTLIHWHGQIPPNVQDGVPDAPLPALDPGASRSYDFAPSPGTHWMHSHIPVQEMQLLAAPLIVRRPEDLRADRQEVVLFLHDFSSRPAEEVLAEILAGMDHGAGGHDAMNHGAAPSMAPMDPANMAPTSMDHAAMGHGDMDHAEMDHDMSAMAGMTEMPSAAMDLNDFDFDAYLANDRTLDDPEVIAVEKSGRVLLRIINGSSATTYWIEAGALDLRLVAVDGQPIQPLSGKRFGIAMGQRLDLEIDLPGAGAWPVLARREGAREQTGLILATPNAPIVKIPLMAETPADPFDLDLAQEAKLRAAHPLAQHEGVSPRMVMLAGTMMPYLWTIDGRTWNDRIPIEAVSGQRTEIMFHNMSSMGHPMHLHGHHFQVVGINGTRFSGALRDTVYVPPMSMITIAIDPGEAARWMLHCHHMPHLQSGMMTEFVVRA